MSVTERWTLLICHRCGRTGLHAGDCYEGAVYAQQSEEIEVVRATDYEGAVSLSDDEWDRVVWWLSRPVPPSPMKALDETILRKIAAARGGQSE